MGGLLQGCLQLGFVAKAETFQHKQAAAIHINCRLNRGNRRISRITQSYNFTTAHQRHRRHFGSKSPEIIAFDINHKERIIERTSHGTNSPRRKVTNQTFVFAEKQNCTQLARIGNNSFNPPRFDLHSLNQALFFFEKTGNFCNNLLRYTI